MNLSIVYANPLEDRKKDLWYELASIASIMSTRWVVGKDFNDILHLSEKNRWYSNLLT